MKTILNFFIFYFLLGNILAQDLDKMSHVLLDSLVEVLMEQGRYTEALPYAEKSVAKTKGVDTSYAESLTNLAALYLYTGQYQDSETFFLKSLAIQKKSIGTKHPNYIRNLSVLAGVYQMMGRYEDAMPLALQASDAAKKIFGAESPNYAQSTNILAILNSSTGQFEEALPLYLTTMNILKKVLGEQHPYYLKTLTNLASTYSELERYEEAELTYLQAKNISEKVLGKMHPDYATTTHNLATMYISIEKYKEALPFLLEVQEIWKTTLGENHPEYAKVLSNLGKLAENIGNYDEAMSWYLKVATIYKKTLGEQHPFYGINLGSRASVHQQKGEYQLAESCLLQTLNLYKKLEGLQGQNYIISLIRLGNFYVNTKAYDTANDYYNQAILVNTKKADSIVINFSSLVNNEFYYNRGIISVLKQLHTLNSILYDSLSDKKYLALAYEALEASLQINNRIRNDFSTENDNFRILVEISHSVGNLLETGLKINTDAHISNLFSFAEFNKSMLLADALKGSRARALGDLPDSLALEEVALNEQIELLKKQETESSSAIEKEQILLQKNNLHLQINAFKKKIANKYPKYLALKYENITASLKDVQGLIDDQTLLLEYFVTDSIIYLFSIDKKSIKLYSLPTHKTELNRQINIMRAALTDYIMIKENPNKSYRQYTETAFWFYNNILKIALNNPNIKNLIIVTDGELGHLPFETFLVEAAPQSPNYANLHYLMLDYNISYNYSATIWKENHHTEKRKNNGQLFSFAASYENKPDSTTTRSANLQILRNSLVELPSAKAEVIALSNLFEGKFLYKADASEKKFKQEASKYSILHLAMHGILNQRAPILSSLAFTEDNDSIEDNFLEAWEISRLKLNADLVVLSACETGYGKFEQGEGVMSLARSFMYAGVPALVVSLWPVNDASTSYLMQSFYENLAAGLDKAAALRQAKLNYLQAAQGIAGHPAFWSPFIQMGDSRPIAISSKKGLFWLAVSAGILALGGIVFAMRRKKSEN